MRSKAQSSLIFRLCAKLSACLFTFDQSSRALAGIILAKRGAGYSRTGQIGLELVQTPFFYCASAEGFSPAQGRMSSMGLGEPK